MIKANHTFLGKQVCSFYAGYKLEQAFRTIEIRGDQADLQLPVLILANHFSKWDGFIQYRINRILYRRKFHVMMLEEQLLKHPILRKGGAFSVRKNSRESLESLRYTLGLLRNRNNLVLLFPQGKIETLYTEPYRFQSGISYLLKRLEKPV
ncbi:MAG: lysophospholipid acyltransferase family protein [Bacteroides sp.]|nr:lysophospholipid acyltransferase family protein [Bacteroides sp.]